jgi:hypothetical protein
MDLQPIGPTRHYVIICHDGSRIDVDAESMWLPGRAWSSGPPWRSSVHDTSACGASRRARCGRLSGRTARSERRRSAVLTRWIGFQGSHRRRGRSQRGSRHERTFRARHTARCAGRWAPRGLVSALHGCAAQTRALPLRAPFRGCRGRVVERSASGGQGSALPASNRWLFARTGRAGPCGFPMSATADRRDTGSRFHDHGRDGGAWWQTSASRRRGGSIRGAPRSPHPVRTHPSERPRPDALTAVDGMGPSRATTLARP